MNRLLACSPLAAALALASCDGTATAPPVRPSFDAGGGQGLNLHAGGFGEASFAAWKSQQGLPDSKGNGNFALYLQKLTATATNAAGFAVITGLEGQAVSVLTDPTSVLSWESRDDGHCGNGAPRWDIFITGANPANSYTVFLGCNEASGAVQSRGSESGWTLDAWSGSAIAGQVGAAGTTAAASGCCSGGSSGADLPRNRAARPGVQGPAGLTAPTLHRTGRFVTAEKNGVAVGRVRTSNEDIPAGRAVATMTIVAALPRKDASWVGEHRDRLALQSGDDREPGSVGRRRRQLLEVKSEVAVSFAVRQPLLRLPRGKRRLSETTGVQVQTLPSAGIERGPNGRRGSRPITAG